MKCYGCQDSEWKSISDHLAHLWNRKCNNLVTTATCNGIAKTINSRDQSTEFKGEKVLLENKVLEVHVEKGMQNAHMIYEFVNFLSCFIRIHLCIDILLLELVTVDFVFSSLTWYFMENYLYLCFWHIRYLYKISHEDRWWCI